MQFPELDFGEKSTLRKVLNHLIAVGLTLLVLGVILISFMMFDMGKVIEQLELKTYDLRAQLSGTHPTRRPSPDIVILEFDDSTISSMDDEYGVWPWPRDAHADMIHFLNKIGVRTLLYDIMFAGHRKGSEEGDHKLVAAFHHYQNLYLSMNLDNNLLDSQKLGKSLTPKDIERLRPLTIHLESELGKRKDADLDLVKQPDGTWFYNNNHMTFNHYRSIMPELLDKGSNVGIINHGADVDGVSRGNPLFFRFQYQPFVKSDALPFHQTQDGWFDAKGNRIDAEGYLYERTSHLPVVKNGVGGYQDSNPSLTQPVDQEGYLLDNFGNLIYKQEAETETMYFPYLGLRALLDAKFPKTPELLLTADGHLKFEGYDIPLATNGDFLVNWHNFDVSSEDWRNMQQQLRFYVEQLDYKIRTTQEKLGDLPAGSEKAHKSLNDELAQYQAQKQKVDWGIQYLDEKLHQKFTPNPYRRVQASTILQIMKKERLGQQLNASEQKVIEDLKDKIVFVGATAVAAYDIKNTSINSTMPGVVLQANLFDNLYQNDGHYLQRANPNVNTFLTIFICVLAAGFSFKMRSAIAGMLTMANVAVLYVLAAIMLYQYGDLWVNIAMPLVALIITTTLTFMVKYILRDKDYEKTYALATTDSMTGLYNHRFFQEHMRRSIEQANKFKHKFSLVLIDIDFFKKFNDTYGHQAGDEVLRQVAKKLKKNVRNVDIVARYGGEEMAIILDRATEEEALAVAHKIVKSVAEEAYPIAEGVAKHVTISCGVATYPTHGSTPSQLIEFSDAGLYRAKENGRNQVGSQYETHPPTGNDDSAPGDDHNAHHAA